MEGVTPEKIDARGVSEFHFSQREESIAAVEKVELQPHSFVPINGWKKPQHHKFWFGRSGRQNQCETRTVLNLCK